MKKKHTYNLRKRKRADEDEPLAEQPTKNTEVGESASSLSYNFRKRKRCSAGSTGKANDTTKSKRKLKRAINKSFSGAASSSAVPQQLSGTGQMSYENKKSTKTFGSLEYELQCDLNQEACMKIATYFGFRPEEKGKIRNSNICAIDLLDALKQRKVFDEYNVKDLQEALNHMKMIVPAQRLQEYHNQFLSKTST